MCPGHIISERHFRRLWKQTASTHNCDAEVAERYAEVARLLKKKAAARRHARAAAGTLQPWAELEKAVNAQIEHQLEYCSWWLRNVRRKVGEGGYRSDVVSNAISRMSAHQAREEAGISKFQVSRW